MVALLSSINTLDRHSPNECHSLFMRALITALTCFLLVAPNAFAQTRGELLYATHCDSCHSTEIHWRDKSAASDWISLRDQVHRWQDVVSLALSENDILEVARYLNERHYHFEQPTEQGSPSSHSTN
jgi:mono/diheme cytochrome c family protein